MTAKFDRHTWLELYAVLKKDCALRKAWAVGVPPNA
jgi:hypothetical protein